MHSFYLINVDTLVMLDLGQCTRCIWPLFMHSLCLTPIDITLYLCWFTHCAWPLSIYLLYLTSVDAVLYLDLCWCNFVFDLSVDEFSALDIWVEFLVVRSVAPAHLTQLTCINKQTTIFIVEFSLSPWRRVCSTWLSNEPCSQCRCRKTLILLRFILMTFLLFISLVYLANVDQTFSLLSFFGHESATRRLGNSFVEKGARGAWLDFRTHKNKFNASYELFRRRAFFLPHNFLVVLDT